MSRDAAESKNYLLTGYFPQLRPSVPKPECSRIFRTVEPVGEDAIPYEFEGFSPRDGDLIERHGIVTAYSWCRAVIAGIRSTVAVPR
jgi:hypothetical protein